MYCITVNPSHARQSKDNVHDSLESCALDSQFQFLCQMEMNSTCRLVSRRLPRIFASRECDNLFPPTDRIAKKDEKDCAKKTTGRIYSFVRAESDEPHVRDGPFTFQVHTLVGPQSGKGQYWIVVDMARGNNPSAKYNYVHS